MRGELVLTNQPFQMFTSQNQVLFTKLLFFKSFKLPDIGREMLLF